MNATEAREGATANRFDYHDQALAFAGIVAPVFFGIVLIALGSLRPEYSHAANSISHLGEIGAPNAVFQNINFFVTGVLVIGFAVGLHRSITGGTASKWGPGLVALFGLSALVGNGLFPVASVELGGAPDFSAVTTVMHVVLALVGFLALIVGMFVTSRRLAQDPDWQGYARFSKWWSALTFVLFLITFILGGNIGAGTSPYGVFQRLFVGAGFLWILLLATHLFRLTRRDDITA